MDKNTVIGFVLIAAVLIGFSYFSRPSEAEIDAQLRQDSIEAVARQRAEQEMKAKAQEARAEVIQAEAEVPKALAQALRDGHMGFMDYYRLENLKGDTNMRENIGNLTKGDIKDVLK